MALSLRTLFWAMLLRVSAACARVGEQGTETLSSCVRRPPVAERMTMFGVPGAELIATELRGNLTLTAIDLRRNDVGGDGAAALSRALRTNKTLTQLDGVQFR